MRIVTLGAGDPEVAVVGGVHGDEPCGVRAIDRFLAGDHEGEVRRPVKLIVANERALDAGERYLEADLNRSFPGDPMSEVHEERLAHALRRETDGCVTLGFHSTVSFDRPFGTLADLTPEKARIMRALPLSHAADFTSVVEGRSVNLPDFVNVEAGFQGSERAAENAYESLLAFLRAMDVLPGTVEPTATDLYRVSGVIEKDPDAEYVVHAESFERVAPGDVYAETLDGERSLRADREFWPVLMSADGHSELLGYEAELVGEIASVAPAGDG